MNILDQSNSLPSLAPGRVIEVVDRTFRIYRDNFIAFIGLVAIFTVPINIITFLLNKSIEDETFLTTTNTEFGTTYTQTDIPAEFWLVILVTLIGAFLNAVVINSVITYIASENYLGRWISIPAALSSAGGRMIPLAVAFIIVGILFGGAAFVLGIGAICIIPLFLFPVLIYLFAATYFYLVPVVVLEDVSAWLGIKRALYLGKVRFWYIFGFAVGVYIIIGVIQLAFGVIAALIVGTTFSSPTPFFQTSTEANALATALSTIVSILVAPILPIGFTLMYYDTRIRVEGLDIALQSVNTMEPRPSDVASPEPQIPLLSSQDLVNIVMLTIGVIVICGGFYALIFALALAIG